MRLSTRKELIDAFHGKLATSADRDGHALAGWSSKVSQRQRFEALLSTSKFSGGSVLDYGCGAGDLYAFLRDSALTFSYRGVDQNLQMVEYARARYDAPFSHIEIDDATIDSADYIFASGIFQFKDMQKADYYITLLKQLFAICNRATAVTFLSAERSRSNMDPLEMYVTPTEVASMAMTMTKFWMLDHSYHPGGGDMTLALFRQEPSVDWARPQI